MQPNTLTRREYQGKIYVKKRILEKYHIGAGKKNHSGSTTQLKGLEASPGT